jgi:hypothetical protein
LHPFGAEGEGPAFTRVGDPHVLAVPTLHADVLHREARLHAERTARPPLAGKAVADGDADWASLGSEPELLAAAGGLASGDRPKPTHAPVDSPRFAP